MRGIALAGVPEAPASQSNLAACVRSSIQLRDGRWMHLTADAPEHGSQAFVCDRRGLDGRLRFVARLAGAGLWTVNRHVGGAVMHIGFGVEVHEAHTWVVVWMTESGQLLSIGTADQ